MKKFSKILLLLLAVVAVMTALTVTALAADSDETVTRGEPHVVDVLWTSNNYEDPETFASYVTRGYVKNSTSKPGKFLPAQSIDGNRYVVMVHDGVTSAGSGYDNVQTGTIASSKYNLEDYPYFTLDMDVMTPDGVNGHQMTAYVAPRFKGAYGDMKNVDKAAPRISAFDLPNNPYEWHHITVVYKFSLKTVELNKIPVLEYSGYVDGKLVIEKTEVEVSGDAWDYYFNEANVTSGKISHVGDFSSVFLYAYVFYATGTKTNNNQKTAIDNFKAHIFPEGYTEEEMANYYNKDGNYQLPFGQHLATITDKDGVPTYYDSLDKAVKAAKDGDTIQLANDVSGIVIVDKAITIDTNKYDANGAATGEFYNIECTSNLMSSSTKDGKITFANAGEKTAFVYWDLCMTCTNEGCTHDGEDCTCTCDATVPGHKMYFETTAALGATVVYAGEIPTFDMKDGVSIKFAGWSRTLGGKIEETTITDADIANGWVAFYPVYEVITYTFEVTTSAGVKSYHMADEFASLFTTVSSGSTIKLLRDLDTNTTTIELTKGRTITFDLNGYDVRRCYAYGTSYKYVNGDTSDEVIETVSAGNQALFSVNSVTGVKLYITSSKSGSDIYNSVIQADTWYNENGEIVKRENVNNKYSRLIYINKGTTTFNMSNVSVYATQFVYEVHGSLTGLNITIDNCVLYRTNETGYSSNTYAAFFFATRYGGLKVSNTKIYAGANSPFWNDSSTASNTVIGTSTFTNCDIIFKSAGAVNTEFTAFSTDVENPGIFFDNCRLYNLNSVGSGTNGFYFSNGTVLTNNTSALAVCPDGYALTEKSSAKTYMIPSSLNFEIDEATGYPTFNFVPAEFEATFTYEVSAAAKVNWYIGETVYKTTYEAFNTAPTAPSLTFTITNNMLLNGKYIWTDANGSTEIKVGSENEYNFYAVENVGDYREYVAGVKDARYSLVFLTQFHGIFYFPAYGLDSAPLFNGEAASNIVYINGMPYYTTTQYLSTTILGKNQTVKVSFTIDGVTYTQSFKMNGLMYADIVLSAPESDVEALAIANMVRYVKSALDATEDTTYNDEIAALIGTIAEDGSSTGGKYDLPAYITEYPDADVNTTANISDYFSEISYGMYSSSVRFILKLKSGVTLTENDVVFESNGVKPGAYKSGNNIYTYNLKVYDAVKPMTITVKVPATETEEAKTITATFSIGAYLAQNPDVELVKALYAFGVSAKAYKESLKG